MTLTPLVYCEHFSQVRREDVAKRIAIRLRETRRDSPIKAFLIGHPGVGKSTEISRIAGLVGATHTAVRIDVSKELNPASFGILEILVLIMIRVAAAAGQESWLEAEGLDPRVLKEEVRYCSVNAEATNVPLLIERSNRLFEVCRGSGKEWFVALEHFGSAGVSAKQMRDVFVLGSAALQDLHVPMLFAVPPSLEYLLRPLRLPFPKYAVSNIPVFDETHDPHKAGRAAMDAALRSHVNPGFIAEGQLTRLIVASGGNLGDLFELLRDASELSRLYDSRMISEEHVSPAIDRLRGDYRRKLGYDADISYASKADRLIELYYGLADASIPDRITGSLLSTGALLEFPGEGWLGIHPLVVDVLKEQGRLKADAPGATADCAA